MTIFQRLVLTLLLRNGRSWSEDLIQSLEKKCQKRNLKYTQSDLDRAIDLGLSYIENHSDHAYICEGKYCIPYKENMTSKFPNHTFVYCLGKCKECPNCFFDGAII